MNNSERKVKQQLESEGWKVLRGGAPDFIALKVDKEGQLTVYRGIEVKPENGKLSYEQKVYQKMFEQAGIPFEVIASSNQIRPSQSTPDHSSPNHASPYQTTPILTTPDQPNPNQFLIKED